MRRRTNAAAWLALAVMFGEAGYAQGAVRAPSPKDIQRLSGAFLKDYTQWTRARDKAQQALADEEPPPFGHTKFVTQRLAEMDRESSEAFRRVTDMVKSHGWVDGRVWGEAVERASIELTVARMATLVNGDWSEEAYAFAARVLPDMKEAVLKRGASAGSYAQIVDDIELREGRLQVYGSNFGCVGGKPSPYSVLEPAKLNERRISIGLGPTDQDPFALDPGLRDLCVKYPDFNNREPPPAPN